MENTVERLFDFLELEGDQFTLHWKWGLDATTTPFFKHKNLDDDGEEICSDESDDDSDAEDSNDDEESNITPGIAKNCKTVSKSREEVLCVFAVPLRLIRNADDKLVWKNHVPGSPRFCRPVRIRFVKETTNILLEEKENVSHQISNLKDIDCDGSTVKNLFNLTMLDGKVSK